MRLHLSYDKQVEGFNGETYAERREVHLAHTQVHTLTTHNLLTGD